MGWALNSVYLFLQKEYHLKRKSNVQGKMMKKHTSFSTSYGYLQCHEPGLRFMTLYRRQGSRSSPWKEMQKCKMVV